MFVLNWGFKLNFSVVALLAITKFSLICTRLENVHTIAWHLNLIKSFRWCSCQSVCFCCARLKFTDWIQMERITLTSALFRWLHIQKLKLVIICIILVLWFFIKILGNGMKPGKTWRTLNIQLSAFCLGLSKNKKPCLLLKETVYYWKGRFLIWITGEIFVQTKLMFVDFLLNNLEVT